MCGKRWANEDRICPVERLDPPVHRATPLHGIDQMRGLRAAEGLDQRRVWSVMAAMDREQRRVLDHGYFLPKPAPPVSQAASLSATIGTMARGRAAQCP